MNWSLLVILIWIQINPSTVGTIFEPIKSNRPLIKSTLQIIIQMPTFCILNIFRLFDIFHCRKPSVASFKAHLDFAANAWAPQYARNIIISKQYACKYHHF